MSDEESPLVAHAEFELRRAGLFDPDADYGGTVAPHVLDLIKVFASAEHSGFTAMLTRELFHRLSGFENLSPLTSDPAEWIDHSEISGTPLWQSRRNPAAFSEDGCATWYILDDQGNRVAEPT
jgi:hypothetical protein